MIQCKAIPYEGKEPYIFFSYCHKDAAEVYPVLEQMVRHGFRIWYDDGNHAGDDWLENIAQHLSDSAMCLAMISPASAASHNCRNEISFAIECKKKLMAVLLENFRMPLGMRMQLGTIHYVKKFEYPSLTALLQKLYETPGLGDCKQAPGSLPMRAAAEPEKPACAVSPVVNQVNAFVAAEKRVPVAQNAPAPAPKPEAVPVPQPTPAPAPKPEPAPAPQSVPAPAPKPEPVPVPQSVPAPAPKPEPAPAPQPTPAPAPKPEPVPVAQPTPAPAPKPEPAPVPQSLPASKPEPVMTQPVAVPEVQEDSDATVYSVPVEDEDDLDRTIAIPKAAPVREEEEDDSPTVRAPKPMSLLLLRQSTGVAYQLDSILVQLGRSAKRSDVAFPDNMSISNHHADIIQHNGQCYLRDAGSSNGTFVGETQLQPDENVLLENPATFRLYNETFHLLRGAAVHAITETGVVVMLRNTATQEMFFLEGDQLWMGRAFKWPRGTFDDPRISRKHAQILVQNGEAYLRDNNSTNGTALNDLPNLKPGQMAQLHSGDLIQMGDTRVEVSIFKL